MASLRRVKAKIQQIAEGNRKNLKLSDIEWIVHHLEMNGYKVSSRFCPHGKIFQVESQTFTVCSHNPGNSQIKRCYVDEVVNAMIELGLYEY